MPILVWIIGGAVAWRATGMAAGDTVAKAAPWVILGATVYFVTRKG
jgi:hypothetical protein